MSIINPMPNIRIKWTILSCLIAAQSAFALFWLLSIPYEKSTAGFLGFSVQRLLLAAIPAGLLVLSIALVGAINIRLRFSSLIQDLLRRIHQFPSVRAGFFWVSFISAAIALSGEIGLSFTESAMVRLQPVLWLVFLVFFQIGLFMRFGSCVDRKSVV